ncbi:MAG: caspase family protein [Ferruginibacter sp.]|nr:caspase family protein [Chitinophagaceae bacterium]
MRYFLWLCSLPILLVTGFTASGQSPLLPRDASIKGPQTFAIIMGVSKYKHVKPLAYADKDAQLFRDYLKSPGGGTVKDENIFLLLNEKASNSNFWGKGFQWLKAKKLQRGDRLFIYLAGHGDAIDEDQFFFLGYDCNPAGDKNNYLVAGAIQLFNLKKKIANETTKGVDVFFIMDACRSGELPGGASGQNFLNTAISEKKAGEIIMLATGAGQESLEDASIGSGQGLFTYYLVDGLNGLADSAGTPDKKVTFREIQNYVNKYVPSVAQQRFNRKQDPYFCCTENSSKIISTVDSAYLQKWLRTKRQQQRGPGNSFSGNFENPARLTAADTILTETYNRFNRAVNNKNITGNSSAEEYYQQLDKKFPGNPYTLDARSTLAVEYINIAQAKVDDYLTCSNNLSLKQKQENTAAAGRLERAISFVREDDADFANSLLGRMYLLKANGSNTATSISIQYAYGALAIDPNGAYILNSLALLHLENNRADSALYYADKAVKTAPNWQCALNTLALIRKALGQQPPTSNNADSLIKRKNTASRKIQFGGVAGGGISKPDATPRPASGNDTIRVVSVDGRTKFDAGIIVQIKIGNRLDIRPSVLVSAESSEIAYERRGTAGGLFIERVPVKTTSVVIPVPFVFRFSGKNVTPFISAGPAFSLLMQKNDANSAKIAIKPIDISGDAGFGVDIGLLKSHLIISPELKYSRGFTDVNDQQNTSYSNVLTKLARQSFTFSIYLRGM